MRGKEPPATKLTREPTLRAEFIDLLKSGMSVREIASFMGISKGLAWNSLKRLVWERAYQLANEDEIANLWTCISYLSRRLAKLENKLNLARA